MFGEVFACGCTVEKWTKSEMWRNFAKIDDFVKYGAILAWFAGK